MKSVLQHADALLEQCPDNQELDDFLGELDEPDQFALTFATMHKTVTSDGMFEWTKHPLYRASGLLKERLRQIDAEVTKNTADMLEQSLTETHELRFSAPGDWDSGRALESLRDMSRKYREISDEVVEAVNEALIDTESIREADEDTSSAK